MIFHKKYNTFFYKSFRVIVVFFSKPTVHKRFKFFTSIFGHQMLHFFKFVTSNLVSVNVLLCVKLYFAVDGGHRAVIFDRFTGIKQLVVSEGTHFYVPWVQRPIIFDVRSRPRNVPVITGSKGLFVYNY